jgi:putative Ca2+/H+ antiporter (TMEM165/GDT1 family)
MHNKIIEFSKNKILKNSNSPIPKQFFISDHPGHAIFAAVGILGGDRTQFTTITPAAHNPIGVALGATFGHAICAAIAVFCGRAIAGRISDRIITLAGGGLFLLFGVIAGLEMQ